VQSLELAVPGTYIAGEALVTIAAFAPQLHVITSKQRPRKLTISGSDGAEYMFLLKVRSSIPTLGIPYVIPHYFCFRDVVKISCKYLGALTKTTVCRRERN
jgi:hypothetical protein